MIEFLKSAENPSFFEKAFSGFAPKQKPFFKIKRIIPKSEITPPIITVTIPAFSKEKTFAAAETKRKTNETAKTASEEFVFMKSAERIIAEATVMISDDHSGKSRMLRIITATAEKV